MCFSVFISIVVYRGITMRITKTTRNMAERRGMTVYVGDEMQCITIALAGEQSDCFIIYKIKDGVLFSYCCTIQQTIQLSDFPAIIRTEAELRAKLDAIRSALYDIMKYGNVVEPEVVEPEVVEVPEVLPRLVSVGDDYVPESQVLPRLAGIVENTLHDLPENSAVRTVLATVLALLRSPVPEMHAFPEVVPVAVPEDEILSETEVDWDESQTDNVRATIVFVIRHDSGKYYHATRYVSLCWENEWNAASEYFTANRALEVVNGLKYTGNKCKVYRREYRG